MKTPPLALFLTLTCAAAVAVEPDARCFELRTYYAAPGKLDPLHARFRNHTLKLFEKHGMQNVGYWVPQDNPDQKLIYLLAHASREAARKSWKAFMADPDWQAARKASEAGGTLVARVETRFLAATDFSPALRPSTGASPRVFELRTYTASPGRLENLLARFRDHTVKLFEKHGMQNIGYWTPAPGEKGAADTLIYLLAHSSQAAAETSFQAFRADPDWLRARKESEEKAGGSLTIKDGVQSVFLDPTDYSPLK